MTIARSAAAVLVLFLIWLFGAAGPGTALAAHSGHEDSRNAAPVAATAAGPVQGEREGGVDVFRGIPYARPPVGALRFLPARPPERWTQLRPALDFSPACPQELDLDPVENNVQVQSEDCLSVNVWTPGLSGAKRPVMVWIHGGAFVAGTARNTWYDGAKLAGRGDVVVVTVQYRLNTFGFLDLSQVAGPQFADSGNLGILDQIEALRWVKDNIAAFGGDPNNVTLFGESAGGASVAVLLVTPPARGLFNKVIIESLSPQQGKPREPRSESARALMQAAGAHTVAELQSLSTRRLLEAQRKAALVSAAVDQFCPRIDGRLLTARALQMVAEGKAARVPVLIGTTLDEMDFFDAIYGYGQRLKPAALLADQISAAFGPRAAGIQKAYITDGEGTRGDRIIALNSDLIFRIPSIRLAEATSQSQPTWMYRFTYRSTSTYRPYRAAHAMELPFVFGHLDTQDAINYTGRDPDRERLSQQMQDAWLAFARSGDPNAPGVPQWSRYDIHRRATMEFGKVTWLVNDPAGAQRRAWDGLPFDDHSPDPGRYMQLMLSNGTDRDW